MGASVPKQSQAVVNVFSDEKTFDEKELSLPTAFSPEDEYTWYDLKNILFQINAEMGAGKHPGVDLLVDDAAGAVCGRLQALVENVDVFKRKTLQLTIVVIKTNGNVFYRSFVYVVVPEYSGSRRLKDLPTRPITAPEKEILKARGAAFVKYGLGAHFLQYDGHMLLRTWAGVLRFTAKGRVMADTASFSQVNTNYPALQEGTNLNYQHQSTVSVGGTVDGMSSREIPEASYHLCFPTVAGFHFRTKRWGEFLVSGFSPVIFRDDAFDKLVLREELKELIQALVVSMGSEEAKIFTDIIEGKGGGCIFLLHGPPGVGKTLTAEAVAELLHKPLYVVDVGELGTSPAFLESKLRQILEVAERWKAVVLIDEVDIFLEARSNHDVLRNAMVGVFLRLLEYHSGVLFLTSNRVKNLDKAFASRISISLHYKDLDLESRTKVWGNLLDAAEAKIDSEHFKTLGSQPLNGRQIKSAIRLASALAFHDKTAVDYAKLDRIVKVCQELNLELEKELGVKSDAKVEEKKGEPRIVYIEDPSLA